MKQQEPDLGQAAKMLTMIYGPAEGTRVLMTILPGITADFRKMLERAEPGEEISEEYFLEDGKCSVRLAGVKEKAGGRITGMTVREEKKR